MRRTILAILAVLTIAAGPPWPDPQPMYQDWPGSCVPAAFGLWLGIQETALIDQYERTYHDDATDGAWSELMVQMLNAGGYAIRDVDASQLPTGPRAGVVIAYHHAFVLREVRPGELVVWDVAPPPWGHGAMTLARDPAVVHHVYVQGLPGDDYADYATPTPRAPSKPVFGGLN